MELEVFDAVKFEKADAIARFNRFRRMTKTVQYLELIVALMLVSWSCTRVPGVVKFSGDCLVELWTYACNPHVVFVIGNAIIVSLFLLCRQTDVGCNSVVFDLRGDDCEEIISRGESQPPIPSPEASAHPEAVGDEEKQIVCLEIAVQDQQCSEISTAMKTAAKRIEKFRRTQSENLKQAIALKVPRELRRSVTEVRREVTNPGEERAMSAVDTVEDLNSEEFRRRVEKFIRQNKEQFKIEKVLGEP